MSPEDPSEHEIHFVQLPDGREVAIPESDSNYPVVPFAHPSEDGTTEFAEDTTEAMKYAYYELQDRATEDSSYRVLKLIGKRVLEDLGVDPITDAAVAELALSVLLNQPRKRFD